MIRARWWKVRARRAGPPTVRAWASMAAKSIPPDPAVATGLPSMAEAMVARWPVPRVHWSIE